MNSFRQTAFFFRHFGEFWSLLWAHLNGRWYYLRDTSDEVVNGLAAMHGDDISDDLRQVIAEAVAERDRRNRRAA